MAIGEADGDGGIDLSQILLVQGHDGRVLKRSRGQVADAEMEEKKEERDAQGTFGLR